MSRFLQNRMKVGENGSCADCGSTSPLFVDVLHGIFICNKCANVHVGFLYPVKSISAADFTDSEIDLLSRQTNQSFNSLWMGKWSASDGSIDSNTDEETRYTFIYNKYQLKRWYLSLDQRRKREKALSRPKPACRKGNFKNQMDEIIQHEFFQSQPPPPPGAAPVFGFSPSYSTNQQQAYQGFQGFHSDFEQQMNFGDQPPDFFGNQWAYYGGYGAPQPQQGPQGPINPEQMFGVPEQQRSPPPQ